MSAPVTQRVGSSWHEPILQAEGYFDRLAIRLKRRAGLIRPVMILPYLGHGTDEVVYLKGRILEHRGIGEASPEDTPWQNLRAMYRRFQSNEIPDVPVRARFRGDEVVVRSDHEGYFEVCLRPRRSLKEDRMWHEVMLDLPEPVISEQGPVRATGRVQIPPADAEYGVISDIDDTVLVTGATRFFSMVRTTLLGNAHSRLPFEGVSDFYAALQRGRRGHTCNPVFYVSSSPWNLYDLLVQFFRVNELPAGTIFLRDLGLEKGQIIKSSHEAHKLAQIERVFSLYQHLPFVLIGDSGQHDPEIYRQAVHDFPGRVRAIYIRDVSDEARRAEVDAIGRELEELGVAWKVTADSKEAAAHAAGVGLISPLEQRGVEEGTVVPEETIGEVTRDAV